MNKKTEAIVLMKRIIKNNPNNELIKQAMKEVAKLK
jgi:hypothetical protein